MEQAYDMTSELTPGYIRTLNFFRKKVMNLMWYSEPQAPVPKRPSVGKRLALDADMWGRLVPRTKAAKAFTLWVTDEPRSLNSIQAQFMSEAHPWSRFENRILWMSHAPYSEEGQFERYLELATAVRLRELVGTHVFYLTTDVLS